MEFVTIVGVLISLLGPAIHIDRFFTFKNSLNRHLFLQAYLLSLVGIVLVVVKLEGKSLTTLAWSGISISGLAWGLLLAASLMWLVYPITVIVFRTFRIVGYADGLAKLAALPRWSLVLAAVVAGISEEVLYRGFALTRLTKLTGSNTLSVLLTVLIFAIVHQRIWGLGASIGFIFSGLALSVFFHGARIYSPTSLLMP